MAQGGGLPKGVGRGGRDRQETSLRGGEGRPSGAAVARLHRQRPGRGRGGVAEGVAHPQPHDVSRHPIPGPGRAPMTDRGRPGLIVIFSNL